MKRIIFESKTVDSVTGEIIQSTVVKKSNTNETFGMHRTTEGIEWIAKFKGNEIQCIMILSHLEDYKTGIVSLSSLKRKEICNILKIKSNSLSRLLTQLEHKDSILRISDSDIILNPLFFYKGSSSNWKTKYTLYKEYKESNIS